MKYVFLFLGVLLVLTACDVSQTEEVTPLNELEREYREVPRTVDRQIQKETCSDGTPICERGALFCLREGQLTFLEDCQYGCEGDSCTQLVRREIKRGIEKQVIIEEITKEFKEEVRVHEEQESSTTANDRLSGQIAQTRR